MTDVIASAKELLEIFDEFNHKCTFNYNNSILFKYLNHIQIASFILPFLDFQDVSNFRATCWDFLKITESPAGIISYYRGVNSASTIKKDIISLKPLNELKDEENVQSQINMLEKIRKMDEGIIDKVYKVETEYLKYEERYSRAKMKKLDDTLGATKVEYNNAIKTNDDIKQRDGSMRDSSESKGLENKSTEEIKKEIERMKVEKAKLMNTVTQLTKLNEAQTIKNKSQVELLEKIRTYFKKTKSYPEMV